MSQLMQILISVIDGIEVSLILVLQTIGIQSYIYIGGVKSR